MLLVVHLMFSSNSQRLTRNKLELYAQGIASEYEHDLFIFESFPVNTMLRILKHRPLFCVSLQNLGTVLYNFYLFVHIVNQNVFLK